MDVEGSWSRWVDTCIGLDRLALQTLTACEYELVLQSLLSEAKVFTWFQILQTSSM